MPTRTHLVAVARKLKQQLNGKAFLTIQRSEITELLRDVSGEPGTRIKSTLAGDLTSTLINQGVQVYPSLSETTTGDTVGCTTRAACWGSSSTPSFTLTRGPTKNSETCCPRSKGSGTGHPWQGQPPRWTRTDCTGQAQCPYR